MVDRTQLVWTHVLAEVRRRSKRVAAPGAAMMMLERWSSGPCGRSWPRRRLLWRRRAASRSTSGTLTPSCSFMLLLHCFGCP